MTQKSIVAVIDCGSQTTALIARRIREQGVFAEIFMPCVKASDLMAKNVSAIILSGGPESLLDSTALRIDKEIFSLPAPILGICYGMQMLVEHFGGLLEKTLSKEFGAQEIELSPSKLFLGFKKKSTKVWMSHTDQASILPADFKTIASSENCPHMAIEHKESKIFGVQFHPEVSHSEQGILVLKNFLFEIAGLKPDFDLSDFVQEKIDKIKSQVGQHTVIMGLSGGVDSMVAAMLIDRAIGDQLLCVYVNHGLHRHGEVEMVQKTFFDNFGRELVVVDAQEQFFNELKGITEPEAKRKIIGAVFIKVFEQQALNSNAKFLGQGTLYPDVIESPDINGGPSHAIKSHHNVGGLPAHMKLQLVEPLRELFKDEVRRVGKILGLSDDSVNREPFPGPGLAVRVPGEVKPERVSMVRQADFIVQSEIAKAFKNGQIKEKLWQSFAILLPVKSVGVMGDARVYGDTIVVRSVCSEDAMTADWSKLPYEVLGKISSRITNEISGINRVLYDITQKPPGTIEWE